LFSVVPLLLNLKQNHSSIFLSFPSSTIRPLDTLLERGVPVSFSGWCEGFKKKQEEFWGCLLGLSPGAIYLPLARRKLIWSCSGVVGGGGLELTKTLDTLPSIVPPILRSTVQLSTFVPPKPFPTSIFCSTKPLLEVDKADWLLNALQVLLLGNHPTLQLRLCQSRSNSW
jgi:hypothetical protein